MDDNSFKTKSFHWEAEMYWICLRETGSLLCFYLNDKNSKFQSKEIFFFLIGSKLELPCLEVCLQPDFTYSLSSLNFSFVTFLQPIRETQTIMGFFLNHSHFQNFTRICQDIKNEFKICSSCLACEFKGNMDFISQEQASKGKCRGKVRIKFIKDKFPYAIKKH